MSEEIKQETPVETPKKTIEELEKELADKKAQVEESKKKELELTTEIINLKKLVNEHRIVIALNFAGICPQAINNFLKLHLEELSNLNENDLASKIHALKESEKYFFVCSCNK